MTFARHRLRRTSRWVAPLAALALLAGLGGTGARAADDAGPMPAAGKATITVTVVDQDGKAVEAATVSLTVPRARHAQAADADPAVPMQATRPAGEKQKRPKALQTTKTDVEGKATFKDVPDGSYVVNARLKGTGRGREKVTVADGKDVSVSVTLKQ